MAAIMDQVPTPVEKASGETETLIHRFTRGGRELWYKLTVLQQPERARACGSGQKAASDRRPVDPPPVIELKIFEGKWEDQKEITFDYNANFFLFASLQQARVIAHGRGMNPPPNSSPVLTGVPVAGMAYLDRPSAAGYFIFPDLSVRHEGHFKLTFSLYETTKEDMDMDRDMPYGEDQSFQGVDWRMEVSTKPFSVYSAKKFPGLMESTHLSKCVADQGCRVRIRRDVRMRKRDGKGGSSARRSDEDPPRQRTVTPATEDHRVRSRSATHTSDHQAPYYSERRPSAAESYPAAPPPPPPPPRAALSRDNSAARGHLAFGEPTAHQYAAPQPHPTAQLPSASPGRPYLESLHGKTEPQSYHHAGPRRPSAPSLPPQSLPSPADHHRQVSISSSVYGLPEGLPRPHLYDSSSGNNTLPPIHDSTSKMRINQLVSPTSPPIEAQIEPLGPPPPTSSGGKRKHDHVFSQTSGPLYNGQRQADVHPRRLRDGLSPDSDHGVYYRADGQVAMVSFSNWTTY